MFNKYFLHIQTYEAYGFLLHWLGDWMINKVQKPLIYLYSRQILTVIENSIEKKAYFPIKNTQLRVIKEKVSVLQEWYL